MRSERRADVRLGAARPVDVEVGTYLLLSDIHLSDRPPSSCTDDYNDDLFTVLASTVQLAGSLPDLRAVVWAGDVFHHKTPGRTSHATVMRAIDVAKSYPVPLWVVPGNHDLSHDRLDSISDTQPLGVLIASGAARLLDGWLDADAAPVYGVPWLQHFTGDTVRAALAGYRDGVASGAGHGWAGHSLVVTHAPLYPPGRELPYEFFPTAAWAAAMSGRGSVYYGHIHEPHGVYTTGGVTFCNEGALSRGSLHEHNLTRAVSCTVWDSGTGRFDIVVLPHKPAGEVFRLKEAEQARTAQRDLDAFLTSVGQTRLEITSIESVMQHVDGLDVDRTVKTAVRELLEAGP